MSICPKCAHEGLEIRRRKDDKRALYFVCPACGDEPNLKEVGRQILQEEIKAGKLGPVPRKK